MTDFISGLLQRSMGLAASVQPLVRQRLSPDSGMAGPAIPDTRKPAVRSGPEEMQPPTADVFQQTASTVAGQAATSLEPVPENPGLAAGTPGAKPLSGVQPMPPPIPAIGTPVSEPQPFHSTQAYQEKTAAGKSRAAARRPETRPQESTGESDSPDIPVSNLVSGRTALRKGPMGGRHPVQPLPHLNASFHPDAALSTVPSKSAAGADDPGQNLRDVAGTQSSSIKHSAAGIVHHERQALQEQSGEPVHGTALPGMMPIPDRRRPEDQVRRHVPGAYPPGTNEMLFVSEPPVPSIEVTIGRVEVKAILPPNPAPAQTPPRRREPAMPLSEYLKSRSEGRS